MELRDKIQNFGRSLSAMVMPNIGAFIAWGLLTALFIPTGWCPNERLGALVAPLLTYLLPLLIGYTAGHNVAGVRGGVTAAVATAGVIVGSDVPMFIGAMIMGPLAGWIIKRFDRAVEGRIRAGFEMLVNNFSIGIIGMLLAIVGFLTIGKAVSALTTLFGEGIVALKDANLLPCVSILIEPAKVMFLNNAINHGILTPLGTVQVKEFGESIIFFLESNPGPGFGMLMAYWVFGRGTARSSAPGAILIQFIGGIHEIYYPYVLSRPLLIVPMILGASSSILFLTLVHAGLVGPISPGSIISVILMAPKGKTLLLVAAVLIAATVTFLTSALIIRRSSKSDDKLPDNPFLPKYKRDAAQNLPTSTPSAVSPRSIADVRHVVFACDAGMGSSALGATRFRQRLQSLGIEDVEVGYASVSSVPPTADIVVCQQQLAGRARGSAPQARVVELVNFLEDPALDALYEEFASGKRATTQPSAEAMIAVQRASGDFPILRMESIRVGEQAADKWEAIRMAGDLLVKGGYVNMEYVDAMAERETITTTYLGMGIAIPHGTAKAKSEVLHTGISVVQFPDGVAFGEERAQLVIGIAGIGDEHLELLARVSEALEDERVLNRLKTTTDPGYILQILGGE